MKSRYLPLVVAIGLSVFGIGTMFVLLQYAPNPLNSSDASGRYGYHPLAGGLSAPGWMMGGSYGGAMMGNGGGDPGSVMGAVLARAPGPTLSHAAIDKLAVQVPANSIVNSRANTITFRGTSVSFAAVASGPGAGMFAFEIAGLKNPTVVVPRGAKVKVEVVNADGDMAHGLVVTEPGDSLAWMPMMTGREAFVGAAVWALGESNSTSAHVATASFTASSPGTYQYLCPVPGHAQSGMMGSFVVGVGT